VDSVSAWDWFKLVWLVVSIVGAIVLVPYVWKAMTFLDDYDRQRKARR